MDALEKKLKENVYPGRGIVLGKSEDGKSAVAIYFIMGRSENSRNRVFIEENGGLRTQAFDPSKLKDPSLIIYSPVRVLPEVGKTTVIVTNGDQTDTIYEGLKNGSSFPRSLESRTFEPDAPNYTPRISGIQKFKGGTYSFSLSILKSDLASLAADKPTAGKQPATLRYTYDYASPVAGTGRYIHTYMEDGNPLPSFEGEPELVSLKGDLDSLASSVWESLNAENKISLYVRFTDIESGKVSTKVINKN
ncbi:MAG: IMP cyclohydrolase [Treponema sp.]|nr:IMP cyclohydrolase [Treponema sp.]